jgi:hypothetical protein
MSAATSLQTLLAATIRRHGDLRHPHQLRPHAEQAPPRPFIVYTGSEEPQRALDGSVHGTRTTFEIQCWADTRAAADALAAAVKTVLDAQSPVLHRPGRRIRRRAGSGSRPADVRLVDRLTGRCRPCFASPPPGGFFVSPVAREEWVFSLER